jgi:hypothetical protein
MTPNPKLIRKAVATVSAQRDPTAQEALNKLDPTSYHPKQTKPLPIRAVCSPEVCWTYCPTRHRWERSWLSSATSSHQFVASILHVEDFLYVYEVTGQGAFEAGTLLEAQKQCEILAAQWISQLLDELYQKVVGQSLFHSFCKVAGVPDYLARVAPLFLKQPESCPQPKPLTISEPQMQIIYDCDCDCDCDAER